MPQKTQLPYTIIETVNDLPKLGDKIVTHDWDHYMTTTVAVTLLTKPRKTSYNDQYYTAWVEYNGYLEHLLICFDDAAPERHGIGGNWEELFDRRYVTMQAKKFGLKLRYV